MLLLVMNKTQQLLRIQTRIDLLDAISILQVRQSYDTNTTALYILVHAAKYLELQYRELMDQD